MILSYHLLLFLDLFPHKLVLVTSPLFCVGGFWLFVLVFVFFFLTYVSNWFNCHIYLSLLLIRSVSVERRDRCTGMQQETQFPHL